MLLIFGCTKVTKSWKVAEETACGYIRMYYMQGGYAMYESEREQKELKKGMLYCFPSRIPYKITQDPENRVECFYMHVDIAPYVLSKLQEIDPEEHPVLKRLIEALLILSVEEKESISGALQQTLTDTIIEYLKRENMLESIDSKIEKSVLYMLERVNQSLKLEEVSACCGYHPQYFIRLFKSCMGETPHQFLLKHRMKTAMTMLLAGESVAKAADAVGYKESKNFSRTFRQVYGISPSDVKKHLNVIL